MKRGLQVENREAPQTQEDILRDLLPHLQYKIGSESRISPSSIHPSRPNEGQKNYSHSNSGLTSRGTQRRGPLGAAVREAVAGSGENPGEETSDIPSPSQASPEQLANDYGQTTQSMADMQQGNDLNLHGMDQIAKLQALKQPLPPSSVLQQINGQQQGNPYANMSLEQLMQQKINGPPQQQRYGPPQDVTTPEQQRMNLINTLAQKDPAAALKAMQEYEQFQHEKAMDLTKMQLEERANNAALVGPIGGQGTAAGDTTQQDQTAQNFQNQLALAQAKTGSNLPH